MDSAALIRELLVECTPVLLGGDYRSHRLQLLITALAEEHSAVRAAGELLAQLLEGND